MDALAGRLETGVLVSGPYALRRQFVFYDRDLWGNRRLKGTCLERESVVYWYSIQ
jgi:hypothetical protein